MPQHIGFNIRNYYCTGVVYIYIYDVCCSCETLTGSGQPLALRPGMGEKKRSFFPDEMIYQYPRFPNNPNNPNASL